MFAQRDHIIYLYRNEVQERGGFLYERKKYHLRVGALRWYTDKQL